MLKKQKPLVSIIVATYKRPDFLAKTLGSILSQTYKNLEIIIINDGSDASTTEVVSAFGDKRVQLLEIKHSGRPAVPRNFGLSHVSGELIAFCDDDDLWYSNKIEEQVKVFIHNPQIKLCYTDCSLINELGEVIPTQSNTLYFSNNKVTTFKDQLIKNQITFSTVMIHKSVFLNGLRFDERPILKASEDYLLLTNIIFSYPIFFIPKPLVRYRVHLNGISYCHSNPRKLFLYYYRMILCFYSFFKLRKISFFKLIFLAYFHLMHIMKQVLFPYYNRLKKSGGLNV